MRRTLLKNCLVFDGTNRKGYKSDILIEGKKIHTIYPELNTNADEIKDLNNLAVSPGFIDFHSHSDVIAAHPCPSEAKLAQGITSEVTGNCGFGFFPVSKNSKHKQKLIQSLLTIFHIPENSITWTDFEDYKEALKGNLSNNHIPLVPHGSLWIAASGQGYDKSSELVGSMKQLLETCMKQGAWGLSTGLAFHPGNLSDTNEIAELCKIVAAYDGIHITHMRNESVTQEESIRETIEIAAISKVNTEITHLKAAGNTNWGRAGHFISMIENARNDGLSIGADMYPYDSSMSMITVLFPPWSLEGGFEEVYNRIQHKQSREQIIAHIQSNIDGRGGADRIVMAQNDAIIGKSLSELCRGASPAEVILDLYIESRGTLLVFFRSMLEDDIVHILKTPWVAIGTDGAHSPKDPIAPHPRTYGTFPKILGKYVREEKILTLEEAIYKMTYLPAQRLNLKDRGCLKENCYADLVVFDPEKVGSGASYQLPNAFPTGIYHVMVNGVWAVTDSKLTSNRPGKVLEK